jgi:hypothetical protein
MREQGVPDQGEVLPPLGEVLDAQFLLQFVQVTFCAQDKRLQGDHEHGSKHEAGREDAP